MLEIIWYVADVVLLLPQRSTFVHELAVAEGGSHRTQLRAGEYLTGFPCMGDSEVRPSQLTTLVSV